MKLDDLLSRVATGEVAIVESIDECIPEDYIRRNPEQFKHLTVQDDVDKAGILWIFDTEKRGKDSEYSK